MKKLMVAMIGLGLLFTTTVSFAGQGDPKKEEKKTKKKSSKKKGEEPKKG